MEGPAEPLQAAATGVRTPLACSPAGSPRGTSVTTPRALHSILVEGGDPPLPSCPWDSSVAQPKFPHPGFELSAHVSVTASGAAGAPCHQRAVVAEEHSPPSPCPWPSFHLPHRASPDPLEHSGTSRGFAVAPRNSSAVVMKVCLLSSLCCTSRSCARHAGRPLVPSLCSPPCGCISPHAHPRTQPHLSRSTPGPGWGLWHGHRSEEQLGTGVPRRRTQHPCECPRHTTLRPTSAGLRRAGLQEQPLQSSRTQREELRAKALLWQRQSRR